MQQKFNKKFIICILLFVVLLNVLVLALPKNEEKANAQEGELGEFLSCKEIIPIGEAVNETVGIMNILFGEMQNIHRELSVQVETAKTAIARFGEDGKGCDTSQCRANEDGPCANRRIKINIDFTLFWMFKFARYPVCIPWCDSRKCFGKPCPELTSYIEIISSSTDRINESIQNIEDVLIKKTETIDTDITVCYSIGNCDTPWTKITKMEYAKRKLTQARGKFTTCSFLEKEEREAVLRGEAVTTSIAKCVEALEQQIYQLDFKQLIHYYKIVKEQKVEELFCETDPDKLKEKCIEGPTEECKKCLCKGLNPNSPEDYDKCQERICKSLLNFVCCAPQTSELTPVTPPSSPPIEPGP